MTKRSKLEVIHDILSSIAQRDNSIRITPLARQSNLSPQSFNAYYSDLLDKGLVKEQTDRKGKKLISVTDKGFKYLQEYRTVLRFIEEFEL